MLNLFENLKKTFLEEWKTLENRIFESQTFNILKEKYQSLSILYQKLIKYSFFLLLFSVLIYLPISYFFSSRVYWADFQEQQELSMELSKMRNKISNSLFRLSQRKLKKNIENIVSKYSNEKFEIKQTKIPLPKKSLSQLDFQIKVQHVNIKQIFRLGTDLNRLSQSRLKSLVMEENLKYPKHYDVLYVLSSFFSKESPSSLRRRIKPSRKNPAQKKHNRWTKKTSDKQKTNKKKKDQKEKLLNTPQKMRKREKTKNKDSLKDKSFPRGKSSFQKDR